MKKVAMFILLKIVELGAILYIPYWIGHIPIFTKLMSEPYTVLKYWSIGILGLFMIAVGIFLACLAVVLILKWINANWKFVNDGDGIRWIEDIDFD